MCYLVVDFEICWITFVSIRYYVNFWIFFNGMIIYGIQCHSMSDMFYLVIFLYIFFIQFKFILNFDN